MNIYKVITIISFSSIAALFISGCSGNVDSASSSSSDDDLNNIAKTLDEDGLEIIRNGSLYFNDVDNPVSQDSYTLEIPGRNETFTRSYENAPPMIPHSLEGFNVITRDVNPCVACHSPDAASAFGTLEPPLSHVVSASDKTLQPNRYNCNLCHVQQLNVPDAINNDFTPGFRDDRSMSRSNLNEIVNEGVK